MDLDTDKGPAKVGWYEQPPAANLGRLCEGGQRRIETRILREDAKPGGCSPVAGSPCGLQASACGASFEDRDLWVPEAFTGARMRAATDTAA